MFATPHFRIYLALFLLLLLGLASRVQDRTAPARPVPATAGGPLMAASR